MADQLRRDLGHGVTILIDEPLGTWTITSPLRNITGAAPRDPNMPLTGMKSQVASLCRDLANSGNELAAYSVFRIVAHFGHGVDMPPAETVEEAAHYLDIFAGIMHLKSTDKLYPSDLGIDE